MTSSEFLQLADKHISANPMDRVPASMKAIIQEPENTSINKIFFDVHAHCFTFDNVPEGFPGIGFQPPDVILKALAQVLTGYGFLVSGGKLRKRKYYELYSKSRFLKHMVNQKTADEVMTYHLNRYNFAFRKKAHPVPHIIMAQLMMDMQWGIKGRVKKDLYGQLEEIIKLRALKEHQKIVLPFFGTDPRNPNLFEDFLALFSKPAEHVNRTGKEMFDNIFPFFGVKIYPSLGYFPSDPKLMAIFEVCEQKNIPVTTHCGSGATRYNRSKYVSGKRHVLNNNGQYVEESYKINAKPIFKKKRKMAQIFNAPNNWLPVIKSFPKLRLNLAHFGSDIEWRAFRRGNTNTHVNQTLKLILENDQVFADFSYACAYDRNLKKIRDWFGSGEFTSDQQEILRRKVLYGSDYYLTDRKKSIITIIESIIEEFNEDLRDQFCLINPKAFLFGNLQ